LYFPTALQQTFRERIEAHQLRREIVATVVTNSLVNRAGPTFVGRLMETTGMAADDIARSYIVAREAFRVRDLWRAIEGLDNKVPAQVQTDMVLTTKALLERAVAWLLANARHPMTLADEVDAFRPGIDAVRSNLADILSEAGRASLDNRRTRLMDKGVPADLAQSIASLPILAASPDVVNIARGGNRPVETVARVYFAVGDRFGINWLRGAALSIDGGNHWEKQAVAALVDDLFSQQSALAQRVLDDMAKHTSDDRDPVQVWGDARQRSVDRLQSLLGELRAQGDSIDLAMLAVGARALRGLGLTGG
jgi:glutamate dehydrogenase